MLDSKISPISAYKVVSGLIGFEHLGIDCIIGVLPHERVQVQPLYVDLKVEANFYNCALSDHVDDTINYVTLGNICSDFAKKGQYQLIEKYAYDVLVHLLRHFPINWGWIKVKKPKAMPGANHTTIELKLSQEEL